MDLNFDSQYLPTTIKTGIVTGIFALAGIAVYAMFKNYNIDSNKEMMNIAGACTSCYLTKGLFSRSAINFSAGCKTVVANIVMAFAIMLTLLFLNHLFYYIPMVVLSSILIVAMIGFVDYEESIHLWEIDKFDFAVCMSAYLGVVFTSIEVSLVMGIGLSILRLLLGIWCDIEQLAVANPGAEVMKKLNKSKFLVTIGQDSIFLTVGEAVGACNYMLNTCKPIMAPDQPGSYSSNA